ARPDYHSSSPGIFAPGVDALEKARVLPAAEATRELQAELLEKLCGVDIWEPFESATHQRPDHPHRMVLRTAAGRVNDLRSFRQNGRRRRRDGLSVSRVHCRLVFPSHDLQTAEVAGLGVDREGRTDLAHPPCARKTGDERGEIRRIGRDAGKLIAIGERNEVRLNSADLFQELQGIEGTGDFAQLGFRRLRHTLRLQEPLARGLWWVVSLGDLRSLSVFLGELE